MKNKHRIMIVEDELIIAMDIKSCLEKAGYSVSSLIISGEKAIAEAIGTHPDLIIMDISLAGKVDGIEAARTINQKLDIPILFLTANTDLITIEKALETDPYGFLLKPLSRKMLFHGIDSALEHRSAAHH